MSGRFDQKVAIVTGAAAGIGEAIATRLHRDGALLFAVDRDGEGLGRLAEKLPGSTTVMADVSEEAAVAGYVRRAVESHGRVDLFANNAGIEGRYVPIVEQEIADFDAVMAVNVRGVFLGLREVLKVMQPQAGGAIVNTASMGGLRGGPSFSPYIASKHAVVGLTRAAALEAGRHGVRVNAVAPGHIDTRMARHLVEIENPDDPQSVFDARAAGIPLGRYGIPEEVSDLVCFLLSDEARYITGTIASVDAGLTA